MKLHHQLQAAILILFCIIPQKAAAAPYNCDGIISTRPCEELPAAPDLTELRKMAVDPASRSFFDCDGVWSSEPCDGERIKDKIEKGSEKEFYLCNGHFSNLPCEVRKTKNKDNRTISPSTSKAPPEEFSNILTSTAANNLVCKTEADGSAIALPVIEVQSAGKNLVVTGTLLNTSRRAPDSAIFVRLSGPENSTTTVARASAPLAPSEKASFALSFSGFKPMPDIVLIELIYLPSAVCQIYRVPVQ